MSAPETTTDADDAAAPVPDDGGAHDLDVVAIGSPLLDVIELADAEQLARSGLAKGSMTLIDLEKAKEVQALMAAPRYVSGGSVANTAAGLAVLGGTAGFVGTVADDEVGRTYAENLRAAGVEFEPHYSETAAGDGPGTGRCIVLITEGADRTMGTYLGAASTMTPAGVPEPFVRGRRSSCSRATCGTSPRPRRPCGTPPGRRTAATAPVALSLSDPFCVSRHQREFLDLLVDDIDVLLGQRGGADDALRGQARPTPRSRLPRRPGCWWS